MKSNDQGWGDRSKEDEDDPPELLTALVLEGSELQEGFLTAFLKFLNLSPQPDDLGLGSFGSVRHHSAFADMEKFALTNRVAMKNQTRRETHRGIFIHMD
jgi:hypothetical protein